MGWPGTLLTLFVVSFLLLVAGDGVRDGGRPKRVASRRTTGLGPESFTTGCCPWPRGPRPHRRRPPAAHRREALVAVAASVVAVLDRSPVALFAAVGWIGYSFALPWKERQTLARFDRIEADLDSRRYASSM